MTVNNSIFRKKIGERGYLYGGVADIERDSVSYFPVEVDTEYQSFPTNFNTNTLEICENLTVQFRNIAIEKGIIHAHNQCTVPQHPLINHPFCLLDYLEHLGYVVSLTKGDIEIDDILQTIQFDIYSFFQVAELFRMFDSEFLEDIRQFVINPGIAGIKQRRRLLTYTQYGTSYFDWILLPDWVLTINGRKYRVRIALYDTGAVHGKTDYKTFCTNSNVALYYKDTYTPEEKANMKRQYVSDVYKFSFYALGDLYNYKALLGNMENFKIIYNTLNLGEYFTPPKLTIGSTISNLFESAIKSIVGVDLHDKDVIKKYCEYATADKLKRYTNSTGCLNAKVDGGRCRNNQPTVSVARGAFCDLDIRGCYGEGLRSQIYPLGIPCLIDYPANSKRNKYQTLREFLSKYGDELVPGLWQARVDLRDDYILKYKQDFIISWFPPKDISRMVTDSELEETDQWWTVDNVGMTKIFTNEIVNGLINHDFVQWLKNIASPRQRKELMDNLMVKTAMFYPKSERVNSVAELDEKHAKHKGVNTTEIRKFRGSSRKTSHEHECHSWYGMNMGELIINQLLIERAKHGDKTPLNELYKLCVNTLYGDMVSPFFKIGNVIVGNNITARARALAWYMEKGLHGYQTITDGCLFDLNRVVYPHLDRRINGEMVVGLYADKKQSHHRFSTLIQDDELSVTDKYKMELVDCGGKPGLTASHQNIPLDYTHNPEDALKWVNDRAMKHLQKLFPKVDVLHEPSTDINGNPRIGQFEFKAKGFFDTAFFHGSANYALGYRGVFNPKMRSYTKKKHRSVEEVDNQLVTDDYIPQEHFLYSLAMPNDIPRSKVYVKERILKCGDYKNNYEYWRKTNVYPGCTIEIAGILHEFSISQFTFQTYDQFKKWESEYKRYLNKYGQSYEMFYLNDNGNLNYQNMIEDVDNAIRNGEMSFFSKGSIRNDNLNRRYTQHTKQKCLDKVRDALRLRYAGYVSTETYYSDDVPMPSDD